MCLLFCFAVEHSSFVISILNRDLCVCCFICIEELEILHANRIIYMFINQSRTSLSPPSPTSLVIYYCPFQGDASVVVYSNLQCSSEFCLYLTYCSVYKIKKKQVNYLSVSPAPPPTPIRGDYNTKADYANRNTMYQVRYRLEDIP